MGNTPAQNDLDILIRQLVSNATGLDSSLVIPGNDNHPAPIVPYATTLEITTIGNGVDAESTRVASGPTKACAKFSGRRFVTYSVQFFKDGAADNAEALISYPKTTPGQIFLNENNLTWNIASDIRNLDGLDSGEEYETRRSVDITFAYMSRNEYELNNIASVEIELTHSDGSEDITETIEVFDA